MAVASAGPYASLHLAPDRQITTPAPHYWVFYRPDALPAAQPTASKHWNVNRFYIFPWPRQRRGSAWQSVLVGRLDGRPGGPAAGGRHGGERGAARCDAAAARPRPCRRRLAGRRRLGLGVGGFVGSRCFSGGLGSRRLAARSRHSSRAPLHNIALASPPSTQPPSSSSSLSCLSNRIFCNRKVVWLAAWRSG